MKLKTVELQNALNRVYRGASNNKNIPLTSLIDILVSDNKLLLTTTDSENYFTVKLEDVKSDDLHVAVNADTLVKLVQKTTTETMELVLLSDCLMVIGNGKYKIDLLLDEEGNPINFGYREDSDAVERGTISTAFIRKIISNNKASLSTDNSVACLASYYCGENILTTDRYKVCQTSGKLFDTVRLLSPHVMELLATFTSDTIEYSIMEGVIDFDSTDAYLYTPIVEGADKMPIDVLNSLINSDMEDNCVVRTGDLLAILDRLSLFVSPYDKNVIYLSFGLHSIEITSKHSNGVETLDYVQCDLHPFTCAIDIEQLRSQVATFTTDTVTLFVGSEVAINLVGEDVVLVIALQEDDRIGE